MSHLVVHALSSSFAEEAAVAAGAPLISLGPNDVALVQHLPTQEASGMFSAFESRAGLGGWQVDRAVWERAVEIAGGREGNGWGASDAEAIAAAEGALGVTGSGSSARVSVVEEVGMSDRLGVSVLGRRW